MRDRPLRQALAFYAWIVAVAAVFDFWVFSLSVGPWAGVGLQALSYALDIAPILICAPGIVGTLRTPPAQVAIGMTLVVAAVGFAVATRLYPHHLVENLVALMVTGICEELSFRGFLWDRTRRAGLRCARLIAANVVAFTAWHLVSVASGHTGWSDLIGILCFGTLASVVRLRVGNTGLPALLHIAVDIAGV